MKIPGTDHVASIDEAQQQYVVWSTRHHWLRKQLTHKRAEMWRADKAEVLALMEKDETQLVWCNAEAEHWMVFWRTVLHAQGVQAI